MKLKILELFQVPEEFYLLELVTRLKRILQYKIDVAPLTRFELLQTQEMIEFLSQVPSASVPKRTRSALHNHLKSEPFLATLLHVDEPSDDLYAENLLNQQYALLTHLYCVRGLHDYTAYLQFYRTFIECKLAVLPLHQLLHLTTREVHQRLSSAAAHVQDLRLVTPFFLKAQRSRPSTNSLLFADNHHMQAIDDDIEYVETSDETGETSCSVVRLASELSLNTEQQRRKFRFKIAGAQRAFYAFENATALGMQAALPNELYEFLQVCAPGLLRNSTVAIAFVDAGYLLLFLFQLFGVPSPLQLILNNKLAERLPAEQSQNYIAYQFEREGRFISAELNLRADLLQTMSPEGSDARIHFVASSRLQLSLPSNILDLLNTSLRAIGSDARHGCTLQKALDIDVADYRRWLNTKLKATSLPIRGIGSSALHRAFLQYSKHTIPETYRAFLAQNTIVQSHYVSAEPHKIGSTMLRAWRDFCDVTGMRWSQIDAHETARFAVSRQFHCEVGSKITLRAELLAGLYQVLLAEPDLNSIAFYVYLRIASTSALRPVREPFSGFSHLNLEGGYMTVADKRVHHADERRFVVLTSSACQLLSAWRNAAVSYALRCLLESPTHALMWFDDDARQWQHFGRKTVDSLLHQWTNQLLKSHSFRHVAARRFLTSTDRFDQRLLNLLMNHSKAGVGLLDRFSALSPKRAADLLRQKMEQYDLEFAELDAQALAQLEALA